jgi:hypothetical protein
MTANIVLTSCSFPDARPIPDRFLRSILGVAARPAGH